MIIVWEDCPERLRVFECDLTPDEETLFSTTHGKLGGTTNETPAIEVLSQWLVDPRTEGRRACIYDSSAPSSEPILIPSNRKMIITGWML